VKNDNEILSNSNIWNHKNVFGCLNGALIKLPDCGTCSVLWNRNEDGYEHVSIAPRKKFNIPSWNDMATLKGIFFYDNEEAYQIMPKKSEYVNAKENCLHIWRPSNGLTLNDLKNMKK